MMYFCRAVETYMEQVDEKMKDVKKQNQGILQELKNTIQQRQEQMENTVMEYR